MGTTVYNGITILDHDPAGDGGLLIQNALKTLADLQSGSATSGDLAALQNTLETDVTGLQSSINIINNTINSYGDMAGQSSSAVAITGGSMSGVTITGYVPTSRTISVTGPITGGGDLSGNRTIAITKSDTTHDGYLSSTDWNTFNNKLGSLPNPTSSTIGGVKSLAAVSHNFLTQIGTDGSVSQARPASSDLSDSTNIPLLNAATNTFTGAFVSSGTIQTDGILVPIHNSDLASAQVVMSFGADPSENATGGNPIRLYWTGTEMQFDLGQADFPCDWICSSVFCEAVTCTGDIHSDGNFIGSGSALVGLNASNISAGTLDGSHLPNPAVSTLGGIKSHAAVTHQFITQIGTDGSISAAQPAAGDITGLATSATTDTTNASNISSGTLPAARLPNPAVSTLGGVKSLAAVSHKFLTSIGTDGSVSQAQPVAGDISGLATVATSGSAADLSTGTLPNARNNSSFISSTRVLDLSTVTLGFINIFNGTAGDGNQATWTLPPLASVQGQSFWFCPQYTDDGSGSSLNSQNFILKGHGTEKIVGYPVTDPATAPNEIHHNDWHNVMLFAGPTYWTVVSMFYPSFAT